MNASATFFGGTNQKKGKKCMSDNEIPMTFIAIGYWFVHTQ